MGSGLDQCLSPAQRADLDRRKIRTLRGIPNPPDPSSCTEASWIRQSYRSSSCHAPLPSLGLGYVATDRRFEIAGGLDGVDWIQSESAIAKSRAVPSPLRGTLPLFAVTVFRHQRTTRGGRPMRLLAPSSDAGDPSGAETGGGRPTTSLNAARHGIAPRSGRPAAKACRQLASFSTILGKISWVCPKGAATSLPARMETQTWAILTAVSSGTS
jgi:hypothetical protein